VRYTVRCSPPLVSCGASRMLAFAEERHEEHTHSETVVRCVSSAHGVTAIRCSLNGAPDSHISPLASRRADFHGTSRRTENTSVSQRGDPVSDSQRTSFSVLVVDDDDDFRDSVAQVLDEDGFAVLTASDGREAIEVLHSASTKPSVILLDMMMPVMDGWEFREAQRNDPELASIPVAVFSAQPNIEATARSIEAAACFRKPLSLDYLIDTLDSLCLRDS